MSKEEFSKFVEKIKTVNEYSEISLDVSYIDNSNNKQSQLIKNKDVSFSYQLKLKQYEFKLKEPIFVSSIDLKSKKNDLKNTVIEVWDYLSNEKTRIPIDEYDEYTYIGINVNRVITSFVIKTPNRKEKIDLISIEINGLKLDDSSYIIESYTKQTKLKTELTELYSKYKAELTEKETELTTKEININAKVKQLTQQIAQKESDIETLDKRLIDLKSSVQSSTESLEDVTKEVEELRKEKNDLDSKVSTIQNDIEQRTAQSEKLNKQISKEKDELKELNEDKSLMAYELKEFVTEANRNILIYLGIGVIPIIVLIYLTYILFNGSSNLTMIDLNTITSIGVDTNQTQIITNSVEKINFTIGDILLSRLPFVLIVISIIIASYEISKIFIKKAINIQNQKMTLSKIGIISKDVSDTSLDSLETIKDEEKYQLRTKLKMDILKEYLKKDVDIEFDYKIEDGLMKKFKELFTKKEQ
ncbi:MAG: hypothetical protein IBX44_10175 [Sulfurospirillum sp.]|nr:hypothetical protein [Sulfurospirillum sp.]